MFLTIIAFSPSCIWACRLHWVNPSSDFRRRISDISFQQDFFLIHIVIHIDLSNPSEAVWFANVNMSGSPYNTSSSWGFSMLRFHTRSIFRFQCFVCRVVCSSRSPTRTRQLGAVSITRPYFDFWGSFAVPCTQNFQHGILTTYWFRVETYNAMKWILINYSFMRLLEQQRQDLNIYIYLHKKKDPAM